MEPKTGKRIVSKGAYVSRHIFRLSGWSAGIIVQVGALIWWVVAPFLFMGQFDVFQHNLDAPIFFPAVLLMATIVGLSGMMFREVGIKVVQGSDKIDPGVPLTRANTADLPAPDSLVRASSEPLQAQEAVLLRAAAEGVDTPADELVRAVEGQA